MGELFLFMLPPLVACFVLTGIHAYLGIHVVERKVIFVDLALAQIAALGTVCAILMGLDMHSNGAYVASLLFTFAGAAVFSLTRTRDDRIPQEAIIGIVYAVSAAAAILVLSKSAEGAEHLREMLVGNILFATWHDIIKVFILYSLVGVFHIVFRRQFIMISCEPEQAEKSTLKVKIWDLLFYMSFGFVVTSSVRMAGVLLVFAFLIVPSVCGVIMAKDLWKRLLAGWGVGVFVSVLGVFLSVVYDVPTGATVVCTFGFILILVALGGAVFRSRSLATQSKFVLTCALAGLALTPAFLPHFFGSRTDAAAPRNSHGHVTRGDEHIYEGCPRGLESFLEKDNAPWCVYDGFKEPVDLLETGDMESVHRLKISGADGEAEARAIASNMSFKNLTALDMGGEEIGVQGIRALSSSSQLGKLESLILWGNSLGDEGFGTLLDSPFMASLKTLDLSDNGITASGLTSLLTSGKNVSLETLNLADNDIALDAVPFPEDSPLWTSIKALDLTGNPASEAWKAALEQRHIIYYF